MNVCKKLIAMAIIIGIIFGYGLLVNNPWHIVHGDTTTPTPTQVPGSEVAVAGYVYDNVTRQGIAGATVSLNILYLSGIATATTDAVGYYRVAKFDYTGRPDTVQLMAEATGYQSQLVMVSIPPVSGDARQDFYLTTVTPTVTVTPSPKPTPSPSPPYPITYYIEKVSDASENGLKAGQFRTRTTQSGILADGWQKVTYTVSGTATNGVDYKPISGTLYVLIGYPVVPAPTDAPNTYIDIKPLADGLVEGTETVTITLNVNNKPSASLNIEDAIPGWTPTVPPTPTPVLTPTPSRTPTARITPTPRRTPTAVRTPTPSITPSPVVTPTPPVTPSPYVLTVSFSSLGYGSVYVNPPGTIISKVTSYSYPPGTVVTLTAISVAGSINETFAGWTGDVTGSQNPATITMNGNKSVTAIFIHGDPTPPPTLNIKMYNGNVTSVINSLSPNFKVTNSGTAPLVLANVKIRYYYTIDGEVAQNFFCDYSQVGSSNVTGTFVKLDAPKVGADYFLEIGFNTGTYTLAPGASIDVMTRIAKSNWTNYTQTNDYSFNSTATTCVDWTKVTGYVSGVLHWGVEP